MSRLLIACVLATFTLVGTAVAADHEVKMLNKGPEGQRNWFEPPVVYAEPGDTIKFVTVDKGHNSASVVIPEGAEPWMEGQAQPRHLRDPRRTGHVLLQMHASFRLGHGGSGRGR